jgi:hypothetical protein
VTTDWKHRQSYVHIGRASCQGVEIAARCSSLTSAARNGNAVDSISAEEDLTCPSGAERITIPGNPRTHGQETHVKNPPRASPPDDKFDALDETMAIPSLSGRFRKRIVEQSRGTVALNFALGIVTGFAIAALLGVVSPIIAAAVGLGAQVVGTIAFFVSYWVGGRD